MIELYILQQLDAFARLGTLSAAAESLYISQPALTRSMKRLEEELGVSLFHRDKRRLTLNDKGRVAADYARRILAEEREMIERIIEIDRRMNTLTLGACAVTPFILLEPYLPKLFPEKEFVKVIDSDANLIRALKTRAHQIAVLHEQPSDKSLYCKTCFREQVYISVPDSHPLAQRDSLHSEDLAGHSVLTFSGGYFCDACCDALPDTDFMLQIDRRTMYILANTPDLLVFNTDRLIEEGWTISGKRNIPLDEPFAKAQYYLACLDAEKERYKDLFAAIGTEDGSV